MTYGDMKEGLKRYGFDDEDPLDLWMNAGLHKFEQYAEWPFFFVRDYALSALAGEVAVTLPTNYIKPINLRDMTGDASREYLEWYDYRRYQREISVVTEVGMPELFTTFNNEILLWRVPSTNRNLSLDYKLGLIDYASNDDPVAEIPSRHHYTSIYAAAYIALMAENEEERAMTAQQQFEADCFTALDFYNIQQLGTMESVLPQED